MRLASYNVENLFERARVMNQDTWDAGRDVLKMHAEMNDILGKANYTDHDKARIVALMKALDLEKSDESEFVRLRQNRGHLVKRHGGTIEVVANRRADWLGWLDLVYGPVDETPIRNTAQVIRDVGADVIAVVEAENRPALVRFSRDVLPAVSGTPYAHVMLIEGNDDRGLDVAIMTRPSYDIGSMCSHVDDADTHGPIFSRDCAQYEVRTAAGNQLVLLINHFKSKGYGSQADSDAKRKRQSQRVREIYAGLRAAGARHVAVLGDLNEAPDGASLAPLLDETDLRDISAHDDFDDGGRAGTYGSGTASNKIDYMLMSPELFDRARQSGIFRKGVWGGKHGDLWPHYPEMTKADDAASDHAALWADVDL